MFGLFSKEKSLQKTIEKATNKLAQQIDRMGALENLKKDGSDDALFGLCKRFGITASKGIEDEQEKDWVVETLAAKGQAALGPVVRYMMSAEQLAMPLRVLERVGDRAKVLEVADQLFKSEPPGYVRYPERRIDLVRWFAEWKPASDDDVVNRIAPYVTDFDENSRFAAIDGLANREPAKIGPPLIAALLRPEEESGRIKRTIVEVLEKAKISLGDKADAVAGVIATVGQLASDFRVVDGTVKKTR
jgi:hypothetical protein